MVPLRIVALCSNVAFLTYGICLHLIPIALLHCALIPINIHRLVLALRDGQILRNFIRWRPPVRHARKHATAALTTVDGFCDPGVSASNSAQHPQELR